MISSKKRESFVQDRLLHILFFSQGRCQADHILLFQHRRTDFLLFYPSGHLLCVHWLILAFASIDHFLARPFSCCVSSHLFWSWTYFHKYCILIINFCLKYSCHHSLFHHLSAIVLPQLNTLPEWLSRLRIWRSNPLTCWGMQKVSLWINIAAPTCCSLRSMWQKHWLGVKLFKKFKSCKIGN